ncbi:MAG: glutamate racemase [Clostridiales Family XIII bacterium]|jgi:glutamate racemase|nr:glutamate racemase [Clostridiales Family XIII bacterium]
MDNRPIGFFDSGLGGLTCIPHLMRELPNEEIIYFGDTARTPYGSKAAGTIINFSVEIADYLVESGVKMIVIACNTATSIALDVLKRRYPDIPVLGIISPAAEEVARICKSTDNIGIIGTKVTIASEAYKEKITQYNASLHVYELATPPFVSLIEEGIIQDRIMDLTIRRYLDDFVEEKKIDTLVLGCTHYPLIKKNIASIYPFLRILNPSEIIIDSIRDILTEHDRLAAPHEKINNFYASDLSDNFVSMIDRIFDGTSYTVAFKNFDNEEDERDARVYIRRLHKDA